MLSRRSEPILRLPVLIAEDPEIVGQRLQPGIGRVPEDISQIENGGLAQHLTQRAQDTERVLAGFLGLPMLDLFAADAGDRVESGQAVVLPP